MSWRRGFSATEWLEPQAAIAFPRLSESGISAESVMTVRHWFSLCRLFTRQDLSTRFQGNIGGLAWAFAAPVLQLAIFYLVFTQIFRARVPGLEGTGYLAFLALGFWPWFAFSEAVARATTTLQEQAGLVRKLALPLSALILARVAAAFALHAVGFAAVLLVLALVGVKLQWPALALIPLLWLPLLLLASGIGLMTAALQVFVRDLSQAIGLVLSLWFFLTPIIYARQMVPEWLQPVLDLNPLTGLVEAHRHLLLDGDWQVPWLASLVGASLLASLGIAVYARLRAALEEFL